MAATNREAKALPGRPRGRIPETALRLDHHLCGDGGARQGIIIWGRTVGLMPIRPEHVFLYPIDWQHISRFIRFERARGACEHCRRPHGQRVFHLGDGRWWDAGQLYWRSGKGKRVRRPTEDILARGRWTRVVLACAHLHHDPSDSAFNKLAALCQRCHMIHDAPEHRRRRWLNAHCRRALGDLFHGPYPQRGAEWITPTPASMLEDARLMYLRA